MFPSASRCSEYPAGRGGRWVGRLVRLLWEQFMVTMRSAAWEQEQGEGQEGRGQEREEGDRGPRGRNAPSGVTHLRLRGKSQGRGEMRRAWR